MISICVLVFTIGILSYLYDIFRSANNAYAKCIKLPLFHLECIIHHLLFGFIITGWMSNDIRIIALYLFTIMMVIGNWEATGGFCSLTVSLNRLCGLPKDTPFHDLFFWTGFKTGKYGDLFYKVFMLSVFLLAMWKFKQFLCISQK